jgi:toxin FitB
VLSELRRRQRNRHVVNWIGSVAPTELFLSTVTIAEIERGIEFQRTRDQAFAAALETWLDATLGAFSERILPVDIAVARRWGRLSARIGNRSPDLAIAATALEHGLTVVTRNVSDFTPTGVAILDPFVP